MRKRLAASATAACLLAAAFAFNAPAADPVPPPAAANPAANVPVKVVVLFSSGVGYFEHAGSVQGNASTELRFKTQQINDILKSLILEDENGGKVTAVTYPSQDPIAKTLKSFQVDITTNPTLGELLNQLRGANVKAVAGAESIEGTILGVEKKPKPNGDKGTVEVWVLNILTGATIRSIELDQVTKLELQDKQLEDELHRALMALAQSRDQDKKPVSISFAGEGQRRVRVGYVVETPVWKTSYRLILDKDDARKDSIQGWAIVENQTDNDWDAVQLSLVSGRPISFIQDLYQPLYIPRPLVKPQVFASLRPQTYEGGLEGAKDVTRFAGEPANMPMTPAAAGPGGATAMGRRSVAAKASLGLADARGVEREELADKQMDATKSVSSLASATKLGELFQYTVGSVTLPRQKSAMIPIVTDPLEVKRLSIYNAAVLAKNPLTGARIKNTTGKHLLAGPITVLDANAYAGDASIDDLPPGQSRLLSYGVDLELRVDSTKNSSDSQLLSGKIVKGVLFLQRKHVFIQEYLAENKGTKDKTLLVEHPLRQGWKLDEKDKDYVKPVEATETLYRFEGKVEANKATRLVVKEQTVQGEEVAILPMDVNAIAYYTREGALSKEVKDVLTKAAEFKNAMTDTQRQLQQTQAKLAQITQEQERLRQNMKTVGANQNSEYYTRLLKKLNDQETQVEKLQTQQEEFQKKLEQQQNALEAYLNSITIG